MIGENQVFGINQLFAGKKDLHVYLTEVQSKKRVPVSMALKLNKYNVETVRIYIARFSRVELWNLFQYARKGDEDAKSCKAIRS